MVRGTANGRVADEIREAREEQRRERREARRAQAQARKIAEAEIVEDKTKGKKESAKDEDDDWDDDDEDEAELKVEEYWSTFGDQNIDYSGKKFKGCRVDAVFGGADVDLRTADIKDKAILRTSSVFGTIIVYVPEDVKVEVASTAIFGGVTDKRRDADRKRKNKDTEKTEDIEKGNTKKTLYIDANCVFGGLEIR